MSDSPVHRPRMAPQSKPSKGILPLLAILILAAAGVGVYLLFWSGDANLNQAMKYAPPDAIGILHIDPEQVIDEIMDLLRLFSADDLPESIETFESDLRKIHSADFFFFPGAHKADSLPFIVLKGDLSAKDLDMLTHSPKLKGATVKDSGNGRFDFNEGPEAVRMIFGNQADDIAEGGILAGPKSLLTEEFIASLGTGNNKKYCQSG